MRLLAVESLASAASTDDEAASELRRRLLTTRWRLKIRTQQIEDLEAQLSALRCVRQQLLADECSLVLSLRCADPEMAARAERSTRRLRR